MKKTKNKTKQKELVLGCKHILKALNTNKKIKVYEVLEDTYACLKCAKNEPKSQKQFMDMFVTICKCCMKKLLTK